MNTVNGLTVTMPVTTPFIATDHRGTEFTVTEVWWDARPQHTWVTLHGLTWDGSPTNTARYPGRDDVSQVPHPGLWFDELAKQITGEVTR